MAKSFEHSKRSAQPRRGLEDYGRVRRHSLTEGGLPRCAQERGLETNKCTIIVPYSLLDLGVLPKPWSAQQA